MVDRDFASFGKRKSDIMTSSSASMRLDGQIIFRYSTVV